MNNLNSKSNKNTRENFLYVFLASMVAALGGLLFGFDTGVISGVIHFVTKYFNLNTHQEGFVVSNLLIGCIIGASAGGTLSDKYGRKRVLILSAVLFAVSSILSALSRNYIELIIGRFIGGVGVGVSSVISTMYIAEISPARCRGRLVSLFQLAVVGGILLSYFTNWLLADTGKDNWRWMLLVGFIPAFIFFTTLFFIPESPRWLIKKGKEKDALLILEKIQSEENAENEFKEIKKMLGETTGSIKELLKPGLRIALLIGILLAILQTTTGIDAVVYYAPKIFLKSGFKSENSALLATVAIGINKFIFTIIAISTVDKFGRKPLLLIGIAGMGISLLLAGFTFQNPTITAIWIIIPILIYNSFYAMSLGPVVFILISEIFPTKIRGIAMSVAIMTLWISDAGVAQTFPWLIEKIGHGTFYLYGSICFIGFIFILSVIKETKGKTLEEIEKMWKR